MTVETVSRPWQRFVRLRLRGLIALVLVIGAGMGWLAPALVSVTPSRQSRKPGAAPGTTGSGRTITGTLVVNRGRPDGS